ncbi:MAG: hypothetical protein ACRDHP_15275 [Ktedonobacterales bacterium]
MPAQERAAEEAARYPTDHVLAVVNEHHEAEQAVQALRENGFTHVELLSGVDALQKIHTKRQDQGPLDKLWEGARKALTDEGPNEQAFLDALRQGHSVVMTQVAAAEDADRADEILRRFHAYSVLHFGQWTVTNLPDAPAL